MPSLNSGHKTNLTSIETALTTAIDSMTNPADPYQWSVKAELVKIRTQYLESMRILRVQ